MVEQGMHVILLQGGLAMAAASDVAQRRVPNPVVAFVAAAGLAAQWAAGGPAALGAGALTGAFTLLLLMLPWAAGGLGGGDVKLAAATAIWLGPSRVVAFLLFTAVAGGPVALAARAVHRHHLRRAVHLATSSGIPLHVAGPPRETVPMAVAIAVGALTALHWGMP